MQIKYSEQSILDLDAIDIWETLYSSEDNIDSPSWHKDTLDKRINKIKNNEAKYISLEELKTR